MFARCMVLALAIAVSAVPYTSHANAQPGGLAAFSKEGRYQQVKLAENTDCFEVSVSYPVFGIPALDKSVRTWAERFFAEEIEELKRGCPSRDKNAPVWETQGGVSRVFSTQGTLSIDFGFYSFTGGAHASHFTHTLILNADGKRLGYEDLFGKTDGLFKALSEYCFKALESDMASKDCWNPSTVREGLAPTAESFKHVLVTPTGLSFVFPEYQVAPYACGGFGCEVPLQALARFAPKPGIWDEATVSASAVAPRAKKASPSQTASPSFNCAKASHAVELAICADPTLARMDVSMAAGYKKALGATANKKALIAEQRRWLQEMHAQCAGKADSACIQPHYEKRIRQLTEY